MKPIEASKKNGAAIVLSSPSGGGKTTICNLLKRRIESEGGRLWVSISATTRALRGAERDGVDYFFVTVGEFNRMVKEGELLEWAEVHGNKYGTPRKPVEEELAKGSIVVFDIDVQGGEQLKEKMESLKRIFILPPSWDTLVKRLQARGTDSPEAIERRLRTALIELKEGEAYEYFVVNGDLQIAVEEVYKIVYNKGTGVKEGKALLREIAKQAEERFKRKENYTYEK